MSYRHNYHGNNGGKGYVHLFFIIVCLFAIFVFGMAFGAGVGMVN